MELVSTLPWDILEVKLIGLADGNGEEKKVGSKMIPTSFT